ncbi:bifunctional biotin--[acetyl-CoA-carboxylase] ligase/biotin operon repressor BirA [Thioalkalicoccus limnaeus]|uniref:Bifunctional ligase/repressor BirA n=1 Tax=Thioalkalicoccus limnaeus TaxID=120681 RepID=A0ABV4BA27_9GAMM
MDRSMQTPLAILGQLSDGAIHSGTAIARDLGLSRTSIWKALDRLRDDLGVEVVAVRGSGYRLPAPIEMFDQERIEAALSVQARRLISGIELHATIDSTNSSLIKRINEDLGSGFVVIAEHQSGGRGRHGRSWVSPFGGGILLSVFWRYARGPFQLAGLSIAAGAAVATTLREWIGEELALKWPNDILWRRRKLAGLLIDVVGEASGPSHVVVGLGVNLRLSQEMSAAIDQPWVDLASIMGHGLPGRNQLAAALIGTLVEALDRFDRDGLEAFLAAWECLDRYRGQPIMIRIGDRAINGIHAGIDEKGALRVLTKDGARLFQAGEVTLRAPEFGDEKGDW